MQFNDYIRAVRRYWLNILASVVLFVIIGAAVILASPKTYSATTELFIAPGSGASSEELVQGSEFYQDRVKTYALIVDSELVLNQVIEDLDLDESANALARRVSASAPIDTVILRITATDDSPQGAAATANAVAATFSDVALDLESTGGDAADSIISVSVVESADVPAFPVSPNQRLILVLSIMLGLLGGVIIAVVRDALDHYLRTEDDVRRVSDVAIVGRIPEAADNNDTSPLLGRSSGPYLEAIRQMRTSVRSRVGTDKEQRSFVVTSPLRGEGKTTLAIGLAYALADTGHNVCLVDADLRRPRIAKILGLHNNVGVSAVLDRTAALLDAQQQAPDSDLVVIPSGPVPSNPSELVASKSLAEMMTKLEARFDFVIVDTPAILGAADAAAIAGRRSAMIMVVAQRGSKSVTDNQLGTALETVASTDAEVWGIALNFLSPSAMSGNSVSYG